MVSKERIILKTCGTTLCLQALPYIMKLAKDECGLDQVAVRAFLYKRLVTFKFYLAFWLCFTVKFQVFFYEALMYPTQTIVD